MISHYGKVVLRVQTHQSLLTALVTLLSRFAITVISMVSVSWHLNYVDYPTS